MLPSSFFGRVVGPAALASFASFAVFALHACGDEGSENRAAGGTDAATPDGTTPPRGLRDAEARDEDAAALPDGTAQAPRTVATKTVTVAGGARMYVLSVPGTYDASRTYPLIVALHGDGGSADSFRRTAQLDAAVGEDAITAYPDQVVDLHTVFSANRDQQFVEALINAVVGTHSVDTGKVWGFGYSKGGFMLNQLACRKAGLFKAIAAHATGAPEDRGGDLNPSCPAAIRLPVLATEGDADRGIGAEYAANYWASFNGCALSRTPSTAPCERYVGCPAGAPVTYCLAPGVTHSPMWGDAARVSWDFFKTL